MSHSDRDGTSLALLLLPYAFSQERLLTTAKFLAKAKSWGVGVTASDLDELVHLGLLVPFYRIDDNADFEHVLDTIAPDDVIVHDASVGRVRDPAEEDAAREPSSGRPTDTENEWDGYYFSSWQILEIDEALNALSWSRSGSELDDLRTRAEENRRRSKALSALSSLHLPGVVGVVRYPPDHNIDGFRATQFGQTDERRLRAAGYQPSDLLGDAEFLLAKARHHDPMADWWPLIRNADNRAWERMSGAPRFALQQRIAAEVLLRSHEALAKLGVLDSLPVPDDDRHVRHALDDRISARETDADGLGRALAGFGLSPTPRVLLIVEGETEMVHVPGLLAQIGLNRPNKVRVHNVQGSNTNPTHLARYVSPRLGAVERGRHFLESAPTALFIAMDPEQRWATEESRAEQKSLINRAMKLEVSSQGGTISDDEIDALVRIFVWGDQKYELANFTDDELADALLALAREQKLILADDPVYHRQLLDHLAICRAKRADIDLVFGRARLRSDKPSLAKILLPVILAKMVRELETDAGSHTPLTPVIQMIVDVNTLVAQLPDGAYSLQSKSD